MGTEVKLRLAHLDLIPSLKIITKILNAGGFRPHWRSNCLHSGSHPSHKAGWNLNGGQGAKKNFLLPWAHHPAHPAPLPLQQGGIWDHSSEQPPQLKTGHSLQEIMGLKQFTQFSFLLNPLKSHISYRNPHFHLQNSLAPTMKASWNIWGSEAKQWIKILIKPARFHGRFGFLQVL